LFVNGRLEKDFRQIEEAVLSEAMQALEQGIDPEKVSLLRRHVDGSPTDHMTFSKYPPDPSSVSFYPDDETLVTLKKGDFYRFCGLIDAFIQYVKGKRTIEDLFVR
jgi:hypothetical protein